MLYLLIITLIIILLVIILLINIKKPMLLPLYTRNELEYTLPTDISKESRFCGHTIPIDYKKNDKRTMVMNISLLLAPWAEYVEFGLNENPIKIRIDIKNNEISFYNLSYIEIKKLNVEFPDIIETQSHLRFINFYIYFLKDFPGMSIWFKFHKEALHAFSLLEPIDIDYWWCSCNVAINYYRYSITEI